MPTSPRVAAKWKGRYREARRRRRRTAAGRSQGAQWSESSGVMLHPQAQSLFSSSVSSTFPRGIPLRPTPIQDLMQWLASPASVAKHTHRQSSAHDTAFLPYLRIWFFFRFSSDHWPRIIRYVRLTSDAAPPGLGHESRHGAWMHLSLLPGDQLTS